MTTPTRTHEQQVRHHASRSRAGGKPGHERIAFGGAKDGQCRFCGAWVVAVQTSRQRWVVLEQAVTWVWWFDAEALIYRLSDGRRDHHLVCPELDYARRTAAMYGLPFNHIESYDFPDLDEIMIRGAPAPGRLTQQETDDDE